MTLLTVTPHAHRHARQGQVRRLLTIRMIMMILLMEEVTENKRGRSSKRQGENLKRRLRENKRSWRMLLCSWLS